MSLEEYSVNYLNQDSLSVIWYMFILLPIFINF